MPTPTPEIGHARDPHTAPASNLTRCTDCTSATQNLRIATGDETANSSCVLHRRPPKQPESWPPFRIKKWIDGGTVSTSGLASDLRAWADYMEQGADDGG